MPEFIIGPAGSGKTTVIYDRIANSDGNIIFIVPDQFLFESEKQIAQRLSERHGNIKVCGFNSLAEDIIKEYGKGLTYADTVAKTIIMRNAVKQALPSLSFYGRKTARPGFAQFMLKVVDEFKREGIGFEDIERVCGYDDISEMAGGNLKSKLSDIALIYGIYDGMLNKSFSDRQDNMKAAARLSAENDCFKGCKVFIDGFDHFGGAQLMLIENMIKTADNCTVTFTLDSSDSDYFLQQRRLMEKLKAATDDSAEGNFRNDVLSEDYRHKNSPALKALRDALPSDKKFSAENNGEIKLFYAATGETEAETVCAEIMKLVREEDYRYKDIAVLTPAPAVYADKMNSAAMLYGIPLFADIPSALSEKPLLKYILSMLIAADNPTGENILRYIKSGFVRVSGKENSRILFDKEIYTVESYCKEWDIYNQPFDRAFKALPESNGLEQLCNDICEPLADLKRSCKGKSGKEMTRIITEKLFNTFNIDKTIMGKCWDDKNSRYNKQLSDEYNQLWNTVSDLLNSVYNTIPDDEYYTLSEYAEILKSCADTVKVSRTPRVLDSVIFGDTVRTRCNEVKAVFIVGATADKFPLQSTPSEIFTKQELKKLTDNEFYPEKTEDEEYSENLMAVYNSLCKASQRLFISYSGDRDNYAECIGLIKNSLGIKINEAGDDYMLYCASVGAARKKLAQYAVSDMQRSENIKRALSRAGETEYIRLVDSALSRTTAHRIESGAELLLQRDTLSPIAIERMCGCRFSYFLKYGLGLDWDKSRKLSSVNIGNIAHFIFKEVLEEIYKDGKPPKDYTPDIGKLVQDAVQLYREQNIPEGLTMSPQYERSFENIADIFTVMLEYIYNELKNSDFIPEYYEYSESARERNDSEDSEFGEKPFKIRIRLDDKYFEIPIVGIADRVDIYKDENGKKQIRVVDYKTYQKKMEFTKNYYGLDLQTLLYLFALTDSIPDSVPAAAVYYPIHNLPTDSNIGDSPESRQKLWMKNHKQQGIVVKDSKADIEKENYTIVKTSKDGIQTAECYYGAVTMEDITLKALRNQAEKVIGDNLERLWSGDVSASPVVDGYNRVACKYCKFGDICNFNGYTGTNITARDIRGAEAEGFDKEMKAYETMLTQKAEEEKQKAKLEKEAEKAQKKAEKDAEKEAEKARKEAEKAQKEAEKAKKAAEKAQKEAEKAKKKAERDAEKAKKQAKKSDTADTNSAT